MVKLLNPKFWQGKRVLITGHTGFMGSWLTLVLTKIGANVSGYSLKPPTNPSLFEILNLKKRISNNRIGNIKDRLNLSKFIQKIEPDIVFHLAAQPLVSQSFKQPYNTVNTNVLGTVNFLESIKNHETGAAIVVTSDKCYENDGSAKKFKTTDPLGGSDPYSASKACAEIITNAWRKSFISSPLVTVRAGNIIGGGDWSKDRLIVDFVKSSYAKKTLTIRNPNYTRPWQHVLDAIYAYLLIAENIYEKKQYKECWNIGPKTNKSFTVLDVVNLSAKEWLKRSKLFDKFEVESDILSLIKITNIKNFKESSFLSIDSTDTYTKLNTHPLFDFETAIKMTIEWYVEYYYRLKNINNFTDAQISELFL